MDKGFQKKKGRQSTPFPLSLPTATTISSALLLPTPTETMISLLMSSDLGTSQGSTLLALQAHESTFSIELLATPQLCALGVTLENLEVCLHISLFPFML